MITLSYSGNNPKLSRAVQNANAVLSAEAFYEKIAALPEYGSQIACEIANSLKEADLEILIESYRNPFGKKATKSVSPLSFKVNISKISPVIAFAVHSLIRQTVLNFSFADLKKKIQKPLKEYSKHESLPAQIGEIAEIISRKARSFA